MATLLNLQNTMNWATPILFNKPLAPGANFEPALSNANTILQTVLGPPFAWPFNRNTLTFTCVPGQTSPQDYVQAAADFGFIEKATCTTITGGNPSDIKEMTVRSVLSKDFNSGRPEYISVQLDDNAGNITFRTMPKPDVAYVIEVTYQKKPVSMISLASFWSPIPDHYAYIYEHGFLALSMLYSKDERFGVVNQKFISHLIGAAQGLDELQRNIFLGNWLLLTGQASAHQMKTTQGIQARTSS